MRAEPAARLDGHIAVPGDKSISHRALILGAIFALLIFTVLLVLLILSLVFRALGRSMRSFRRYDRWAQR